MLGDVVNGLASAAPAAGRTDGFDEAVSRMLPVERLERERGALREAYRSAKPFPHLVLDGYFDEAVLDRLAAEFPPRGRRDWLSYDTENEIKQTSRGIVGLPPFAQAFLWQMCSPRMLEWLRFVTDSDDLFADPTFHGGGLHESFRGGWLNVHADWTQHPSLPLTRRLNMIVYLNRGWDPAWRGALELHDPATRTAGARVDPHFNRAVIFPTTSETLHGFPDPLACPPDRSRKSVSVFYWGADEEALQRGTPITFLPGRRRTRVVALVRSFIPPVAFTVRDAIKATLRGRARAGG